MNEMNASSKYAITWMYMYACACRDILRITLSSMRACLIAVYAVCKSCYYSYNIGNHLVIVGLEHKQYGHYKKNLTVWHSSWWMSFMCSLVEYLCHTNLCAQNNNGDCAWIIGDGICAHKQWKLYLNCSWNVTKILLAVIEDKDLLWVSLVLHLVS